MHEMVAMRITKEAKSGMWPTPQKEEYLYKSTTPESGSDKYYFITIQIGVCITWVSEEEAHRMFPKGDHLVTWF